jgi:TPP-dependent pyruvate/acetoin dehydrogenase alpha subunit
VLVIDNNGWAISLTRSRQSVAQMLAQTAIAGGVDGEQVDDNDAVAVRYVVQRWLDKACSGAGPSLLEAIAIVSATIRLRKMQTVTAMREMRSGNGRSSRSCGCEAI